VNDFCNACGKREGRLAVHHIEKYYINEDDRESNLTTLCPKCHSAFEKVSDVIAEWSQEKRATFIHRLQGMLGDWWHIHQGRRLIAEGKV